MITYSNDEERRVPVKHATIVRRRIDRVSNKSRFFGSDVALKFHVTRVCRSYVIVIVVIIVCTVPLCDNESDKITCITRS